VWLYRIGVQAQILIEDLRLPLAAENLLLRQFGGESLFRCCSPGPFQKETGIKSVFMCCISLAGGRVD